MSLETIIDERMTRFHTVLDNAKFGFKQHQYDGVVWCARNELRPSPPGNVRGGFIADEMGLGKTILMIGTIVVNFLPRTLIVVPPVLIHQWHAEIERATGYKALLYYRNRVTQEQVNKAFIVLTTYNMVTRPNCLLKNLTWSRIIFDEAHHLRNSETMRYSACRQLKSRIRWLVTGTPVQNKMQDFYNLCFMVGMKSAFYTEPANLPIICQQFILRRTKAQVGIQLPELTTHKCVVSWKNNKEKRLSEEIHALLPNQCNVSSSKYRLIAECFGRSGPLVAILRARQSCIMPSLMRSKMEQFCANGLIPYECLEALNYSSKLDAVMDLMLSRKDNGRGKIVFCHYQAEIDQIELRLREGGMQKVVKYDGRSSNGVSTLSEAADALIMQIQTGCEGLNLQANFSEIYFVSPHWNPCVEDQAVARCHRIGQTRPVDVFKFEMKGFRKQADAELDPITLEKYVNKVQEIKRDISRNLLRM